MSRFSPSGLRSFLLTAGAGCALLKKLILTMQMALTGPRFQATAPVTQLINNARERIDALPGVLASAVTMSLPLQGAHRLPFDYFRIMRRLIEQPDILPPARSISWSPQWGNPLTQAITFFSLRTLLRSRQHRMILGFYLGLGVSCAVGYANAYLGGFRSAGTTISVSFLLVTIVTTILTIFSLRVVASLPISLSANWVIRITQIRPARDYQKAVRMSWLALGLAPPLLLMAATLVAAYPWAPALGHFLVMLCLGILLVELCLYTFPKIPFTCSYLPGKAQIDFVFWACLMLIFRLLNEGAEIESRMLRHVLSCTGLILTAAIAAGAMRWLSQSRASSTEDLLFEEEYSSEVTSLKLN